MTQKHNAPAAVQQGANNLNEDTNIVGDTQLKEQVEIIIPDNSKLDTTLTLPTWGLPHLEEGIFHISDIYGCSPDYVVMGQIPQFLLQSVKILCLMTVNSIIMVWCGICLSEGREHLNRNP